MRHAVAIVLLPGTVTIVVPTVLTAAEGARPGWGLDGIWQAALVAAGLALIGLGLVLAVWTFLLFARIGKGTPAPWDPPRRLVVHGPYRHVRNPMISAVAAILLGEAAALGRASLVVWLALFVGLNHIYFVLVEEPSLIRRFGDDYRAYKLGVPRWVPRRTPYL
jgi:protein-S-isoprenylcysteine O-methyltransferase Ste14